MKLGDKIHQLRKASGMSQEELASQLTISRQAISKWELGESVPDTENVLQLSKLFGVSTDYLLNDDCESDHEAHSKELSEGKEELNSGNAINENAKAEPHKPPLMLDIIFLLVAVLAAWSILRIPAIIGHSVLGFLTLALHGAAILYIPIYLFLIRPRRMKHAIGKALIGKAAIINKVFWCAGAVGALLVCFFLSRHIFLVLYNNTDWPIVMLLLGLVVICIASFPSAKRVIVCTVAGYVVSFIIGILFNREYDFIADGVVQSRNYTAWQIWTISFVIVILIGVIWEIINNRCVKLRRSK